MVYSYRHQPVKTLYILGSVFWILFRVPFWFLRNLLPSWRPRRNWSLTRSVVVALANAAVPVMMAAAPPSPQSFEKLSKTPGFVWVDPVPEELIVEDIKRFADINDVRPERVGGFWYTKDGAQKTPRQAKAQPGEKVLYLLHGGGFFMGSASPSFGSTVAIAQGLLEHASTSGYSQAFAVEYRLAAGPPLPVMNPFPACLLDVLSGYQYLIHTLHFAPENIIVAGDSAGGTLAYQLVRYCTMYGDIDGFSGKLPSPGGLLLLSPSVDAFRPVPNSSMIDNRRSDYVLGLFDTRYPVFALLGKGLTESDIDRPWFSPGSSLFSDNDEDIKGVFTHFPKTMIVTGEAEMSRDCNRLMKDRMARDMGKEKVVYAEIQDAPHDFLGATIWEPERTTALKQISKWIAEL